MKLGLQFEKGNEFIKNLKPSDKVILVHHKDADGSYSAAIASVALKRMGKKLNKIVDGTTENSGKIINSIKAYNKVIIFDIGIELLIKDLNNLDKEILYIDHHLPVDEKLSKNIVYINPRLEKENFYQPATYVVYKFFSAMVDIRDKEWLAVIGTVADYGYEDCRDLLDKYFSVADKRGIWKTKYGEAAIVTVGAATEIGFSELVDMLVEAADIGGLMGNKKIQSSYRKYQKLYEDAKKLFWKNAERFDEVNLIFSTISSKAERVGSAIATETSTENSDKIIFLLEKMGGFYKIHARYQTGKINLGKMLRKMRVGGGHCLTPDTLIPLSNGDIKPIGLLNNNIDVISGNFTNFKLEKNKSIKFLDSHNNENYIYHIFSPPYNIKTSGRHRFFVFDNGFKIKKASELTNGDLLLGLKNLVANTEIQKLPKMDEEIDKAFKRGHRLKRLHLPEVMTGHLAQILGYLIGDGNVYAHDQIEFKDQRLELVESYKNLMEGTFEITGKISKVVNKNAYRLRFFNSVLAKLFEKLMGGNWPKEKFVPDIIKRSPNDVVAGFLKGIFDAEGCIEHHEITLSQSTERLIKELQLLLLRFGILSNYRKRQYNKFTLSISSLKSIEEFRVVVNFTYQGKKIKLDNLIETLNSKNRNTTIGFAHISTNEIRKYLASYGCKNGHKWFFKHYKKAVSHHMLDKLSKGCEVDLSKIINSPFLLCKVKKVKKLPYGEQLYDLEVPNLGNFVANGLIVHNSAAAGGKIKVKELEEFKKKLVENLKIKEN